MCKFHISNKCTKRQIPCFLAKLCQHVTLTFGAHGTCPAWLTRARASHRVALSRVLTSARLGAHEPKVVRRTF